MEKNNSVAPDPRFLSETSLSLGLALPWWLVAGSLVLQSVLTVYLVFGQPARSFDARFLNVTDSVLDLDARVTQMEQENRLLFRMLRNENEQRGLLPERSVVPAPSFPAKKIGDTLGDLPGESPY